MGGVQSHSQADKPGNKGGAGVAGMPYIPTGVRGTWSEGQLGEIKTGLPVPLHLASPCWMRRDIRYLGLGF